VICLLLSGDGKEVVWIWFLRGDSDEDEGDNYGICNFLSMMTWRIRFSDGDIIKAEMVLLPWNNFLWSFLRFVVVRSNYDEGIVRISLLLKPINGIELRRFRLVFLILRGRRKTQERRNLCSILQTLAAVRWVFVYMRIHLYESSLRFDSSRVSKKMLNGLYNYSISWCR
jgi:hypothetical protein